MIKRLKLDIESDDKSVHIFYTLHNIDYPLLINDVEYHGGVEYIEDKDTYTIIVRKSVL